MNVTAPKVVLRLGSHAEKEYFEKLAKSLHAIAFGGNLLEITPAATCSLLISLGTKRAGTPVPFYIDPMTYCFGRYIDPDTGKTRRDLEALKSERPEQRGSTKKVKSIKESYMSLAHELGSAFRTAVNDGRTCTAVDPATVKGPSLNSLCQGVVEYQMSRLQQILDDNDLMNAGLPGDATPAAVFAPYFFVAEQWADEGLKSAMELAARTAALKPGAPVHAVICCSHTLLRSAPWVQFLIEELPKTKVEGVWLWFDGFDKLQVPPDELVAFRRVVCGLKGQIEVYNLHGGYFSLLLAHDGLRGISHGVGYGEQKSVTPVIGAAAPTVRYYLPAIARRVAVPDIQRCLPDIGIDTPAKFFEQVCGCAICKGVIGNDLSRFAAFGEMHRASASSTRDSQTPAAAKMCRYHFLINRLKEPASIAKLKVAERAKHVTDRAARWRACYPLRQYLGDPKTGGYIERWAEALAAVVP